MQLRRSNQCCYEPIRDAVSFTSAFFHAFLKRSSISAASSFLLWAFRA